MGLPLQVMRTSSSLYTVILSFVKMDMFLLSLTFPSLMSDSLNQLNVSPLLVLVESPSNGRSTLCSPWLTCSSATRTVLVDLRKIFNLASLQISSVG